MYFILILITILTILIIVNGFYRKIKVESHESFKSDYSDYNTIDRILVDDKFAYCIGGSPICKTGVPIKGGVYANGNTYKSYCDDGSNMVCNNFVLTSNLDICGNSYLWRTPTLNNVPILFSQTYQGFTEPTSYIPAIINNNSINLYDSTSIRDTINKCEILGLDKNNCKKALKIPFVYADTKNNDVNAFNNTVGYNIEPSVIGSFDVGSYTEKTSISNGKSGMYPNLPCIADYGALPGDNVCNGEIGLIQDDTLVCPYYKPICKGYRCGTTFGNCDYSN